MPFDPNQPRDDEGQWTAEDAAKSRSRTHSIRESAVSNPNHTPKTSNETMLARAAIMYGTDSAKYKAAVKKLGKK